MRYYAVLMFIDLSQPISDISFHRYAEIVKKVLTILPKGITAEFTVSENQLMFQIHFDGEETNYVINTMGHIYYLEPEYHLQAEMTTGDIVADYYHFKDDKKTG